MEPLSGIAKSLALKDDQSNGPKLVSIFVVGVQKGGTTSMDAYMYEHPDLSAPTRKELEFFSDETLNWKQPDYTKLHDYFSVNHGERLRFEVTPIYMFWPNAIERIRTYNPNAKLIFLFRDPFERAWSHWAMEFSRGREKLMFGEAIRDGTKRLEGLRPTARAHRIFNYVERGFYSWQVRRALTEFPRNQLLFLLSEELLEDPKKTLSQISTFLGISPFPNSAPLRKHKRRSATDGMYPSTEDREFVYDNVHQDVIEFAALTGLDVSRWPTMQRLIVDPSTS